MNTAIIISSFISALLLLITIFYNGGLRKTENSLSFKEQVNSLNYMGKSVVIIVLLLATADPTISVINNYNANEDYKQDTIRLTNLIKELQEQKVEYINRIDSLTILTRTNNDSINSINRNIIQVAADESRRNSQAIERSRQNIYLQYKAELFNNYCIVISALDSTNLWGFIDLKSIPNSNFSTKYIKEMSKQCNQLEEIQYYQGIIAHMDMINTYLHKSLGVSGATKKFNIEAILRYKKKIRTVLAVEMLETSKYEHFKDFYQLDLLDRNYYVYEIDSLDNYLIEKYSIIKY